MKAIIHYLSAGLLGIVLLSMTAPPTLAQKKNPERDVFFGQTHSHTSWSVDAYLIGNHLTGPEEAYKYSLRMPVRHPMGFNVKLKGRPLDF